MLYNVLWVAWIVAFLGIELTAVFNAQHGDTLSEKIWRWVTQPPSRSKDRTVAWWVWLGRTGVAGLLGWMALHFLGGF